MRISALFLIVVSAVLVGTTGCSPEHPAPPTERNELVMRFFKSIRNGDCTAAAQQGEKIYQIDRNNLFVQQLVAIQQSNAFVRDAQRQLNSGDVQGAIATIERGKKVYPDNQKLRFIGIRLAQVRNASKQIYAMEHARNSTAMMAALTAIRTAMADNISPRLAKYLKAYEGRIEQKRNEEKLAIHQDDQLKIRSFDEPEL